jgi:hypothetical protein
MIPCCGYGFCSCWGCTTGINVVPGDLVNTFASCGGFLFCGFRGLGVLNRLTGLCVLIAPVFVVGFVVLAPLEVLLPVLVFDVLSISGVCPVLPVLPVLSVLQRGCYRFRSVFGPNPRSSDLGLLLPLVARLRQLAFGSSAVERRCFPARIG